MAKDTRKKRRFHSPGTDGAQPLAASAGADHQQPPVSVKSGWLHGKRPILRFVLLFAVFVAIFYVAMTRPLLQRRFFSAYLDWNAAAAASILNVFGEEATAYGKAISSGRASIQIMRGCDAIEPTALFVAAVLATPVSIWSKVLGAAGGTLVLALINLVRIVTLFYTRVHFPKLFEVMHVEVWQGLFICLSLVLWIAWALWATRPPKTVKGHVSA